ncbi:MAG: DUF3857 domain-containing protein, partial [Ferruginibacter sp.]
ESSVNNPIFEQTSYHSRLKIFNKKGFDVANIKIWYPNNNLVSIKNFSAQTYNLDAAGNIIVTKVDKAAIFDKKINNRWSERVFVFPDIKEGSVIEYKYRMEGVTEVTWRFQRDIPVRLSRFVMDFPRELIMRVTPFYSLPVLRYNDEKALRNYTTYTMENIPALEEESYMTNRQDYIQRLETRLVALEFPNRPRRDLSFTWPSVVKKLLDDEDFGKQLKKNLPRTIDLDKALANVNDPYLKMQIIHRYVKDNMVWDKYDNIWAAEGVRAAWKSKKGTSGEINLILINLLRDADLKTVPLLVSTREHGRINTMMPGYEQFNKVLAYVTIGDKNYVLDAVDKATPPELVPLDFMVSEGLLIKRPDNYDWGWITIWNDGARFQQDVFLNAEILPSGKMQGVATVTSAGYKKLEIQDEAKEGNENLQKLLIGNTPVLVDSFSIKNVGNDSLPVVQTFKFTALVSSSGDYNYFSLNYFTGFEKNPFIKEERKTDIFFGAKQEYKFNSIVFLPEGYTMRELPKNIKLIMPDTSIVFKRISAFDNDMLSVTTSISFTKPFYPQEDYEALRDYYKKMAAMLDQKFVYIKKKN